MKKGVKTNPNLEELISELKRLSRENDAPIWRNVAKRLEKPARVWSEVNITTLEKYAKAKENVIVPGKLLGIGNLSKPVNVAAYSASAGAVKKVEQSGGSYVHILEMAQKNPKGSGIRILG